MEPKTMTVPRSLLTRLDIIEAMLPQARAPQNLLVFLPAGEKYECHRDPYDTRPPALIITMTPPKENP
jgi:hypothetical protein